MGSNSTERDDTSTISAMILSSNMVFPPALNAAIQLNVFEIIAKESSAESGGFMSPFEIASKLPIQQHYQGLPNRLERLLRLLASYDLLTVSTRTEEDGSIVRLYGISAVGKYFVYGQPNDYVASALSFTCHPALSGLWLNFKEAVVDPDVDLFKKVHGISLYEYFGENPDINHIFNKAMTDVCSILMNGVLEMYKGYDGISTLVDVGGGNGQSLKMIISKYPSIKAINFDLPQVIVHAPPLPGIEHVGGDMFESVPQGDAIMLKAICHNWSDEKCIEILRNCYKALPPNGKVIIVELIQPENPEPTDASKLISIVDNFMFIIDLHVNNFSYPIVVKCDLRIEHVGGDMFESVPQGDAIMLKAICHNWSDEKCIEILRNCYKALAPNGKVIIVEFIQPENPEPTDASKLISIFDNFMFITAGGMERTEKQYENLGKLSGFSKFQVACRALSVLGVMELHK